MSFEDRSGFGDPTEDSWDDGDFPGELTTRLSNAFSEQADRFEPSNDSYRLLAEAVDQRAKPRQTRWVRPLAAAAAVVTVAGLGVSLLAGQNTQSVGTGPAADQVADQATLQPSDDDAADDTPQTESTEPMPDAEEASTEQADQSASQEAVAEETPPAQVPPPVAGPVRSTELAAAQAFLDLLRLPHGQPELVDGNVVVRSRFPGGGAIDDEHIVATLSVIRAAGGYAVSGATTENVTIDDLSDERLPDGLLRVAGTGIGFDTQVDVRAVAAYDNRVLAIGSARTEGDDGRGTYLAELPVIGAEHAWIVVSQAGGAGGSIDPFAAKLVSYRAGDDKTNYGVVRVPADDSVNGLNVRDAPGVNAARLAVVPAGADGVMRTGEHPVPVGDDLWWSVTTAAGDRGWVNSRFLASLEAPSASSLERVVAKLGVGGTGFAATPDLPLTRRAPIALGSAADPSAEDASRLFSAENWSSLRRSVDSGEDGGDGGDGVEPPDQSLAEFLQVDRWQDAEVDLNPQFNDPADAAAAERYFAGLTSFAIVPAGEPGQGKVFVFVEQTPSGAEIVGIIGDPQP